ncbi:MAG TPA: hypothetical protein VL360_04675 [Gammaproteobacteria bacterium]|nr:hypothetical protein [Gammaproteobacteria bacterium]
MLNRDDDKYQGSDDSEYHFSDDEMHYDAEGEQTKQAPVERAVSGSPASPGRLKRMGIGFGVFLVLVFVAYKMVAPVTSVPATDIVPQAPASVAVNIPKQQAQMQQAAAAPAAQQAAVSQQQNQQTAIQQMQQMTVPPQEVAPAQQPEMQMPGQQTQQISQSQAPANNVMQQVNPAQTGAPQNASQQYPSQPSMQQMQIEGGSSALAAENARLTNQLQTEYAQRLSEYQTQNRNLEDQVQTLNNRVANMESEMNQLIQTLTQQYQTGSAPGSVSAQPAMPVEQAGPPPKVPYAVQAIIPGRAWLRSNNGDTLTVAEGDEIKGIGRVTKIDPYDGVVEINVHGRAVTLSYGNGS